MAYTSSFDAEDKQDSLADHQHQSWTNMSFNPWSTEGSYATMFPDLSSPATVSLSSGRYTFESADTCISGSHRSSNVSPTASTWSNEVVSPPVTPQQNGRWCPTTPIDIRSRANNQSCLQSDDPIQHYSLAEEDLWIPKTWDLPLLPSAYPKVGFCNANPSDLHAVGVLLPFTTHTVDPPLSRHIFANSDSSPMCHTSSACQTHWLNPSGWSGTQTIAPTAAFQPLMTSSPPTKIEISSPLGAHRDQSDVGFDSSPIPVPIQRMVPSQGSRGKIQTCQNAADIVTQPILSRRTNDRGTRRQYHRKTVSSVTCKPRKCLDDTDYDNVIPPNTFACTFPGCIDKGTGRQKRFKRQEHRKRHEITVHKGEKKYYCWVPGCLTGFTRTDNLKNHIKSTHGKNSPAQRNRYVATLDSSSEYYDPQWQGGLTDDGYPLRQEVETHQCWVSECEKTYHLKEKLSTHLLQQHGRKSSNPEILYVTALDEDSELFDPDWEDKNKKEGG